MALLGLLFFLPALLTIAFILCVVPGGALVLLILAVGRWRRSRKGWLIVKLYCGGLALFALGCLPIAAMMASDAYDSVAAPHYHYTLDAPRELDGITFPANSDIQLSSFSPHHVLRGHLGAPTTIAGLRLVNDFAMSEEFAMPKGTIGSGELAEPHDIDGLPCGTGRFSHNSAYVSCTPTRDIRIGGILLKGGEDAQVKASQNDWAGPDIKATLAEPTHLGRFDCAPGPFTLNNRETSCVLAADQDIDGYILRGGTQAGLDRIDEVESWLTGTLAQPLNVDGVVLPAGTVMERSPRGRAETMRDHIFVDGESAWFVSPGDATIAMHGGQTEGRMWIDFGSGGVSVEPRGAEGAGVFVLGGERVTRAMFHTESGSWELHR